MESNWGIIGHEWAIELLSGRIATGKTTHATLITGPQGVGKMLLAMRLAQAVVCTEASPPCGECRACLLVERGQHPDVHLLEPENERIRIETIRELQNTISLRPFEAPYRVAIIRRFHRATEQAMDSLLKTLEEPPSQSKLILTADLAGSLLDTIVSRCQGIALRPVPTSLIETALIEREGLPEANAALLAHLSGGRPGWALDMARDAEAWEVYQAQVDGLMDALRGNRSYRFTLAEEIAKRENARSIVDLLEIWQSWWRDVLLIAAQSGIPPNHSDRVADLQIVAEAAGIEAATRAINAIRETVQYLDRNANQRLALEVMMLELPYL
jgi:DNA polymerase-3 subunit delta'